MRHQIPVTLVLAGAATLLCTSPLFGVWPDGNLVIETVHNLSHTAQVNPMSNMIADYGEACVYCHAPHGTDPDTPPLWNRQLPTVNYRMFDPADLDMIADPQPTGISLVCLSCHDGTIGLDEVIAPPLNNGVPIQSQGEVIETCANECHNGGNPDGGLNWENVYFRPDDMRKQHPISLIYDPSRDPDFNSVAAIEAAGIVLYDGKLQCGSCHDPHSQQFSPFLRINNSGNSICFTCHTQNPGESTAHFW